MLGWYLEGSNCLLAFVGKWCSCSYLISSEKLGILFSSSVHRVLYVTSADMGVETLTITG